MSGRKIMPGDAWDLDHKVALANGGRHAEDNLAPALRDKHREKTARDVAEKSRVASVRKKHLGIKMRKAKINFPPRRTPKNYASAPLRKWAAWNPHDLTAIGRADD
nr:hypothetical protein [Enterovirga sp. DB1703]